ncbi:hypothetical protein VNO77_43020 [Canavalia gladiata]|uniref:Uncharacterized protein n=1 Tax=Canavalia gladiata TaxID=3824 RepID=A0AAN9PMK1_CANGL
MATPKGDNAPNRGEREMKRGLTVMKENQMHIQKEVEMHVDLAGSSFEDSCSLASTYLPEEKVYNVPSDTPHTSSPPQVECHHRVWCSGFLMMVYGGCFCSSGYGGDSFYLVIMGIYHNEYNLLPTPVTSDPALKAQGVIPVQSKGKSKEIEELRQSEELIAAPTENQPKSVLAPLPVGGANNQLDRLPPSCKLLERNIFLKSVDLDEFSISVAFVAAYAICYTQGPMVVGVKRLD